MKKINVLYEGEDMLGEGPLWLADEETVCWVDILKNEVYTYCIVEAQMRSYAYAEPVTLLVESTAKQQLVVAMKGGIGRIDLETGQLTKLKDLEIDKPNSRTNDGGVDSKGRLWVGTMDLHFQEGAGSLYLLTEKGFVPKIEKTTIANGLVWSKDGRTMYFIDSPLKTVKAYRFEGENASLELIGDVVRIPEELGAPDGMAIDEDGMLWIAHYGGYSVGKWNPNNGELLEKISIPAPNVTACCFGGADMRTLFITTARQEMSEKELEDYPLSGSLFCVETDVSGVRKNKLIN